MLLLDTCTEPVLLLQLPENFSKCKLPMFSERWVEVLMVPEQKTLFFLKKWAIFTKPIYDALKAIMNAS